MKRFPLILIAFLLLLGSCKSSKYTELGDGLFADIQTNKGAIIVRLEYDKTPVTVANFVSLAEGTNPFVADEYKEKEYYDGLTFHRVMKDFMIQGGDPLGQGTGGPGYKFRDEFHDSLRHDKAGILSMANPGANANGSQFFITHKPTPWLDGKHSVFGEVVAGMAVVDSIANTPTGEANRPLDPVIMEEVEIVRNGNAARQFNAVEVLTNYFAEEEAAAKRIIERKENFATTIEEQRKKADSLPSGLKYIVLQEGSGPKPKIGQKVMVDYAGWLKDGSLFDTSEAQIAEEFGKYQEILRMHRGNLVAVPMDYSPEARLIAGFKEGLMQMQVGDRYRFFIPPYLGYGAQGSGPIPPNADLVFDIEIVRIAE